MARHTIDEVYTLVKDHELQEAHPATATRLDMFEATLRGLAVGQKEIAEKVDLTLNHTSQLRKLFGLNGEKSADEVKEIWSEVKVIVQHDREERRLRQDYDNVKADLIRKFRLDRIVKFLGRVWWASAGVVIALLLTHAPWDVISKIISHILNLH